MSALWWVKPSSRVTARSWSLVAKPRGPKAGGVDWFLTQLGLGSECLEVCCPASGQGQGPASLRSESGLLMDMLGLQARGFCFSCLFSVPWWMRLLQSPNQAPWRSGLGPRVFWDWCLPGDGCSYIPGPSGVLQGHVQRWLWAQRGLTAACLLVSGVLNPLS